jgi:Fe-S-cluster-containing dehydrogenase component
MVTNVIKAKIMPRFEIRIDHNLCWGCKTCEVACKQENRAPEGVKLIWVEEDGPRRVDDKLEFSFRVNLCRHCEDPPCVDVCPDEAIAKRDDGIVIMDTDRCTGCQACIAECPYDAIAYDHRQNIANKCNLCHHRIDQGLIPACADNVCLAHCIHFRSPE